jgi:PepSY-associated TM region
MLRWLVPLHRWLGVAFCLPVAIWFASGIVMHFVPFPAALPEAERAAGRDDIDLARVEHGPTEAIAAGGAREATRVRLIERPDGPIYLVSGPTGVRAVRADDLADGALHSQQLALSVAMNYARGRDRDFSRAAVAGVAFFDQWTISAGYDSHRPLYRVALDDDPATDLYVSSTTGEVVLETTRSVRGWNYLGSVAHWIYFTGLRSHAAAWNALLRWLSLLALIGAVAGAIVGPARLKVEGGRLVSPFRGWQVCHHRLGLVCMPFLVTWLLSGWLSMDDGLLFSSGKPTPAEANALIGEPLWSALPPDEIKHLSAPVREVQWFAFGGRIYRGERQSAEPTKRQPLLRPGEIDAATRRLQRSCEPAFPIGAGDSCAAAPAVASGTVVRVVCGNDWFQIDTTDGAVEKIDGSRRSYRWLHYGLHRFDWPFLANHPAVRTVLIVLLSATGLVFSFTAVAIGCRRLVLLALNCRASGSGDGSRFV